MNFEAWIRRIVALRRACLPVVALVLSVGGAGLRLAHPERASPWHDEFMTLLHASGHGYEDLEQLFQEPRPISARELQRRYFQPSPGRGVAADLGHAMRTDLQASPLYYALVRLSLQPDVEPLTSARYVAALLSVALLPAFFWVCFELFRSWTIAWVGLSLLAVAPSQLDWAFEARSYSLWGTAIVASTAALLRAMRVPGRAPFLLYTALTAVLLWSHLLSSLILAVHGLWVLVYQRRQLKGFAQSAALAVLAASPWLLQCVFYWNQRIAPNIAWLRNARQPEYFAQLSYALGHGSWASQDNFPEARLLLTLLAYGLEGVALLELVRRAKAEQRFLVLGLLLVVLAPLAAADVIWGGARLSNVRYLLPSTLAILLSVAFYLGSHRSFARRVLLPLLLGVAALGSVSSAASDLPEGKRRTEPVTLPSMKLAVERLRSPVVVSLGQVSIPASLSMVVPPDAEFLFLPSARAWPTAEALLERKELLLIESRHLPWYYEPNQERADRLRAELAGNISVRPVARGMVQILAVRRDLARP